MTDLVFGRVGALLADLGELPPPVLAAKHGPFVYASTTIAALVLAAGLGLPVPVSGHLGAVVGGLVALAAYRGVTAGPGPDRIADAPGLERERGVDGSPRTRPPGEGPQA